MPFMVIYSTSDGTACHEQADAIDEAALFVERLRNKDGIEQDIRIYRMEEISFAFRPYYKVELGMPERFTAAPSREVVSTAPIATEPAPMAEASAAISLEEPVELTVAPDAEVDADVSASTASTGDDGTGANGRRGLFGR